MNIKNLVNWKMYFILLSASVLSILAIMPYIITIQGDILKAAPIPFPLVILIIVAQSALLFAVLTFIGLKLSNTLGLQIPIIERIVAKKRLISM